MKNSLINKLKNKLAVPLIAGGLALGVGGCVTAGKTMQTYPGTHTLGNWTELAGSLMENERKKREEAYEQQGQERYFFTCNYLKDFDNDGKLKYPEEFVGIKKTFKENEMISIISYDNDAVPGSEWEMRLFNQNGGMISKSNFTYSTNSEVGGKIFERSLPPGIYKAIFNVEKKYIGSTEFEVIPQR